MTASARFWGVVFASVTIVISLVVYADMSQVSDISAYDSAGPRLFPLMFATGLLLCGAVAMGNALRRPDSEVDRMDLMPVVLVSAGLVVQFTLIETLGWIVVATVQFVLAAQAFGRFGILKSTLFGLVLATVTYVAFTFGLQLDMPLFPLGEQLFAAHP